MVERVDHTDPIPIRTVEETQHERGTAMQTSERITQARRYLGPDWQSRTYTEDEVPRRKQEAGRKLVALVAEERRQRPHLDERRATREVWHTHPDLVRQYEGDLRSEQAVAGDLIAALAEHMTQTARLWKPAGRYDPTRAQQAVMDLFPALARAYAGGTLSRQYQGEPEALEEVRTVMKVWTRKGAVDPLDALLHTLDGRPDLAARLTAEATAEVAR